MIAITLIVDLASRLPVAWCDRMHALTIGTAVASLVALVVRWSR